MPFQLRDYQKELVSGIKTSIQKGNGKILAVSPAGSGKSVVMADVAKGATDKGNRVLFIVHRIELVQQIKKTFASHGVDMSLCQVDMIQTVTRRLRLTPEPSVIICDECHHALSKTYQRVFDHFPKAFSIGFTATPILLSGKGLGSYFEDMVEGKSVEWLINNHCLAPFDYFSVNMVNESKLGKTRMGDYTFADINEATKGIIYGDVIANYRKLADGTKTIIYTHSVQASKDVAKKFQEHGYAAKSVDGKTPEAERKQIMADFLSGKVTILSNAELYGEGVDIPDCETVILLRPTASLSLYIQQAMRPMRYKPGKRATIIDHVANYTKHGLPDTPREWSLEDWKQNASGNRVESSGYKQCPDCFTVMKSMTLICEACGHVFAEENEMTVQEAELVEIKQAFNMETNYAATKPLSEINTMAELKDYQKAKGYKPGWVYFQAKLKKLIK